MFNGEDTHPESCSDCGVVLELDVLRSAAGYYIGTECACGPYSRESDYFLTSEDAHRELADFWGADVDVRPSGRSPGFQPGPLTVTSFESGEDLIAAMDPFQHEITEGPPGAI